MPSPRLQDPRRAPTALESTRQLALASLPRRIARRPRHRPPSTPDTPREFCDGEVVSGTRYRVERLLGSGGMGRVYEVEHVELGKRFVLKALQQGLARRRDLVERLRNEWRALARLDHPNIVNVTDAGTSVDGVTYYVMERLEGETLALRLFREGRLLPQAALAIATGILEGLSAAHRIGVVHRDVKPPNVFLISPTAVKLLDFGIAKIDTAKNVVTARGTAVGTPRYMSPEQANGVEVDARSDIYSAGLILFEMLSGRGPFDDARDANELLLAHLSREAPLLSSVSVVAPELDRLVAGMLAKDPRQRPHDALALAQQLQLLARRYDRFASTDDPTLALPVRCVAALAPPTLYGADTLVDSVSRAPTVVPGPVEEKTQPMLAPPLLPLSLRGAAPCETLALASELLEQADTRTARQPLPPSLPVVRPARARRSLPTFSPRAFTLASFGAAALALSAVAGALLAIAPPAASHVAPPPFARPLPPAPALPPLSMPASAAPVLPVGALTPEMDLTVRLEREKIPIVPTASPPQPRSRARPRQSADGPLKTFVLPPVSHDPGF